MKKCSSCKKKFAWKALGCAGGNGEFCSMACLPEGELDESYALDYFHLLNAFEEPPIITSMTHQHELLVEVDYLFIQYEEHLLGDLEGSYYKQEIRELLGLLFKVRNGIEEYFTIKENFRLDMGLFIGWDTIRRELSEGVAINLQTRLQQQLDTLEDRPMILYNQSLNAVTEWQNILYFEDGESYIDTGIHPDIKELYTIVDEFLKPFMPENYDGLLSYVELGECPICGIMEPWEDFNLKETEHVQACWSCQ